VPGRILIVDDNAAGRYALARVLQREGFQVLEAGTGAEARELVQQQPNLVILDVHLPDTSGFDLLREMRGGDDNPQRLVLMVSATAIAVTDRVTGLEGGADGYLVHPVDPLEMGATVRALLRLERAMDRANRLASLSGALVRASQAADVARLVVESAVQALDGAGGAMVLAGERGALAVAHAVGPLAPDLAAAVGAKSEAGTAPAAWLAALRHGWPYWGAWPAFGASGPDQPAFVAMLPLQMAHSTLGSLLVSFDEPPSLSPEERAVLAALAQLGAQALDRLQVYEAERQARAAASLAAERAGFLAETSRALAASLDYEQTLHSVARLALPLLGDGCSVFVLDDQGQPQRVAHAGIDLPAELAAALDPSAPGGSPARQALQTGLPVTVNDLAARALGLQAVMALPLRTRAQTLGVLQFVRTQAGAYGPAEAAVAEEVARRAATAVDNARLYAGAQALNAHLEERVQERTGELQAAVESLAGEVAERRRVEAALERSREELRALSTRLQLVREEERARLSREIHDELGGTLTGLKIDLAQIRRSAAGKDQVLSTRLGELSSAIDRTVQVVRRIASDLRPGILDEFGLVAAIEWQLTEFSRRTGITTHLASDVAPGAWERDSTTALFRIFQEALTNVARHAQATQVDVSLVEQDKHLVLEVRDNGRGFSTKAGLPAGSLGLVGMRERVHMLAGQFEVRASPGGGTRLRVSVPVDRVRKA
jgi:signal transduction histidine kinase/DNA-binding NarL/FixJ family response regulator